MVLNVAMALVVCICMMLNLFTHVYCDPFSHVLVLRGILHRDSHCHAWNFTVFTDDEGYRKHSLISPSTDTDCLLHIAQFRNPCFSRYTRGRENNRNTMKYWSSCCSDTKFKLFLRFSLANVWLSVIQKMFPELLGQDCQTLRLSNA